MMGDTYSNVSDNSAEVKLGRKGRKRIVKERKKGREGGRKSKDLRFL